MRPNAWKFPKVTRDIHVSAKTGRMLLRLTPFCASTLNNFKDEASMGNCTIRMAINGVVYRCKIFNKPSSIL